MKADPLISIIVPVYNVEPYLKRCVESITAQSYKNLEILLIDDGSTDSSGRLCDELAHQDKRIRVFHQENKGLSGARNKGLDEMKGSWAFFVDSDDYISSDCIDFLYGLVEDDVQVVSGKLIRTNQAKVDFEVYLPQESPCVISGRKAMEIIYGYGPKLLSIVACGKLIRRKCFDTRRFREGIIHEDEELMWKLLYECDKIAVTQRPVYAYVMTSNSIMRSKFNTGRLVYLDILDERAAFFAQTGDKLLWELTQKTRCYVLFELSAQSGHGDKVDREVSKRLRKEFNLLFPTVVSMKVVDRKSKSTLVLMRFFPVVYTTLKRCKNAFCKKSERLSPKAVYSPAL